MTKQITYKRLYNIALFYLSRYESSSQNVRHMLLRRVQKAVLKGAENPPEARQWIDGIVNTLIQSGYINDERYAQMKVKKLVQSGKSNRFVQMKLREAGIDSTQTQHLLNEADVDDVEQARLFLKRKKMGPFRRAPDTQEYLKKDLSALARAGFSYETAQQALRIDLTTDEFDISDF